MVRASRQQQHYWDCPYQFGSASSDHASDAELLEAEMQEGDVVVLASDGVYDNVFDREIEGLVYGETGTDRAPAETAAAIAEALTSLARRRSLDTERDSPYSLGAIDAGVELGLLDRLMGKKITGGKVDDTTAVVAVVEAAEVPAGAGADAEEAVEAPKPDDL